MSATTDQMTTAITNIEAALAALGVAFASYEAGRATAKSAHAAAAPGRGEDIDNALSHQALCRTVAGRMRALQLEPILHAGAGLSSQPASWTTGWVNEIVALVP